MSKARSPKALRARARELQRQAKIEEDKLYQKVGRMITKELNKKEAFTFNDATEIKAEIINLKEKIDKVLKGIK